MGRHGVNFGVKFFLYFDDIFLISLGDEVDGQADLSESAGSTDTMQVCAAFPWEVEIDDDIDSLNIDAPGY